MRDTVIQSYNKKSMSSYVYKKGIGLNIKSELLVSIINSCIRKPRQGPCLYLHSIDTRGWYEIVGNITMNPYVKVFANQKGITFQSLIYTIRKYTNMIKDEDLSFKINIS